MTKLVVKSDQGQSEIPLGASSLNIGRRPENELVIGDVAASGRHAVVSLVQDQYYVEDLKSSNGTLVNGARITRHALRHGDVITIGRQTLEFMDGSELLGTLVMMAPPQQKAPPSPAVPDDGLPKFIVSPGPQAAASAEPTPPTRPLPAAAAPAAPMPPAAPATNVDMLDQLVGSIRSHRDREKTEREQKQAQVQVEWERMLKYAEQMKLKIGADPRVKYFGVSRAANDIMIRFQRDPKSPLQFLMLSLYHPDQKNHTLTGIWMRRTGEQDRCFPNAEEAASELVREMAFLLA